MKTIRRKFTIFEQMDLEFGKNKDNGPVVEFMLTPDEFHEFQLTENGRASFKKIIGRTNDLVGGDWTYKGALITIDNKSKKSK